MVITHGLYDYTVCLQQQLSQYLIVETMWSSYNMLDAMAALSQKVTVLCLQRPLSQYLIVEECMIQSKRGTAVAMQCAGM